MRWFNQYHYVDDHELILGFKYSDCSMKIIVREEFLQGLHHEGCTSKGHITLEERKLTKGSELHLFMKALPASVNECE